MEHDDSEKTTAITEKYAFLKDRHASAVFGRLDYELKSGRHIQHQHPDQEEYYGFIRRNLQSLREYYNEFFSVNLEYGGIEPDIYFYLNYEFGSRVNIPSEKREMLDAAHLIIGIFACKIYFIDVHPENSSITAFKHLMMEEYEEYRPDFFRLLAEVKDSNQEQHLAEDEAALENAIRSAFREFEKLGWVYFTDKEKGQFTVLPALDRLRSLYAQEISSPRQLAEQFRKEV